MRKVECVPELKASVLVRDRFRDGNAECCFALGQREGSCGNCSGSKNVRGVKCSNGGLKLMIVPTTWHQESSGRLDERKAVPDTPEKFAHNQGKCVCGVGGSADRAIDPDIRALITMGATIDRCGILNRPGGRPCCNAARRRDATGGLDVYTLCHKERQESDQVARVHGG
jgi:hypothetical protein